MSESRSVKSTKTVFSGFISNTVSAVLSFVLKTVFIKVFGVDMLGINGLFANILAILSLADLGFNTAMAYSYYKPIAEQDHAKIAALNQFYKKVYSVIALVVALVGVALIPFLKYIINLDREIEHLYLYYILTLANTVVSYLFVYKSTVINANQQGYVVTNYNMLMNLLSSVVQIAVIVVTKNYIAYLCVIILFTIINNLYISHVADRLYPYIKEKHPLPKGEQKNIFKNLNSVFLYKLSSVMLNSTDNIIISRMIGTVSVGYYSNYLTVINLINAYVNIAFSSLTASIGNLMVKDTPEKQYRIFKNVQIISAWFSMVIAACVYTLINDFIVIWLGESFLLDDLTVAAIGLNFFLGCILYPIWIFREAAGIYRKTKYIMVICAVLNIALSVLMAHYIGLAGVLFASALSKLLTYIWYEPIVLFRDYFKKSAFKFFLPALGITGLTAAMCFLLRLLCSQISISGVAGFIVKGVVCFVLANLLYLLLFFKNKYLRDVLKHAKQVLFSVRKRKAG